jgi:hypothetical protein
MRGEEWRIEESIEHTSSLMRDSIGPVTKLHLICLDETTGSMSILHAGGAVKPNQILLLGGFFILTSSVPSSSRRMTARTSFVEYDRDPRERVATVSTVTLTAPTNPTWISIEASPSAVKSLSMGREKRGRLVPTLTSLTLTSLNKLGSLTRLSFRTRREVR